MTMIFSETYVIQLFFNESFASMNNIKCSYIARDQTQIIPWNFRGMIDELKIYSRELSASNIFQLVRG